MDYNVLKQEFLNDPEDFGYMELLESGAHNVIEEVINNKEFPQFGPVTIDKVLIWLATYGILPRLRAATVSENQTVASIAEIAILMIQNPNISAIDLSIAKVQEMFGVLVSAGVITEEESDDLFTQSETLKSRADELGLGYVGANDIAKVAVEVLSD